jgi:cytoskeletal protein CcmA (bactofilin family)
MEFVNQLYVCLVKPAGSTAIKIIACIALLSFFHLRAVSQNVGIGTNSPQRKLTVRGSIMVDQGSQNPGSLDSAALIFGAGGTVGITSRKTPGLGVNGLSFWTNGQEKMMISSNGNVGINGAYNNSYKLIVNNGDSYLDGDATVDGDVSSTNNVVASNSVRALNRLGVGGNENNSYRLYVHSGNSYFQGNITSSGNATVNGNITAGNSVSIDNDLNVSGTITATNNMVIKGTGSVRSQGPSPLRVGFVDYNLGYYHLNAGEYVTVFIDLPEFDAESDIRVLFSDYRISDIYYATYYNRVHFRIVDIDAVNDRLALRVHNYSNADAEISGTLTFLTVVKDN